MDTVDILLDTDRIVDWKTFHESCGVAFGFPEFHGRNMDAWIDCLTYLDEGDGMSGLELTGGQMLNVIVTNSSEFKDRVPEIFSALIEGTAAVNGRYAERQSLIRIAMTFLKF